MNSSLSICIPTFNRAERLKSLLQELTLIVDDNIFEVIVLDNASTDSTAETVSQFVDNHKYRLIYIKNEVNIGGNANILRCFEKTKTKWVWIIGDDDKPVKEALNIIAKYLNSYADETLYMNFSTDGIFLRDKDIICNDLNSFFSKFDSYSNILFLSASIFNREKLIPYLRFGYIYNYSLAPHLAILISGLNEGKGKVLLSSEKIIQFGHIGVKTQKWSYFNLFLGMVTLLELPKTVSKEAYKNFTEKIGVNVILDERLFNYLIKYYFNNPGLRKYLFNQIVFRNYRYVPNKSLALKIKMLGFWILINNDFLLKKYISYRKIDIERIEYPINIQPLHNRL